MKKWLINLVIVFIFSLACLPAFAAPPWHGEITTTFQQWSTWSTSYGYVAPDAGWFNNYGTPSMFVNSGELDITIPNSPVIQPEKEIWVDITWKAAGLGPLPDQPLIGVMSEIEYDMMTIIHLDTSLEDGWMDTVFKINIWPNPSMETIVIKGDIYVNQVVVDTRCIPEPATLLLLTLGGLFLRKQKLSF
jgi:hypothetical protein